MLLMDHEPGASADARWPTLSAVTDASQDKIDKETNNEEKVITSEEDEEKNKL